MKLANGKACYKNVACTSGSCLDSVCKAPTSTSPGSGAGNLGDFSSGPLGDWNAQPANKVSVVADAGSPGGYFARLIASGGVPSTITRSNIPASVQRRSDDEAIENLYRRAVDHLDARFEFRLSSFARLPGTTTGTGCGALIIVNGQDTGLQSIGGSIGDDPALKLWYNMSNGIIITDTD